MAEIARRDVFQAIADPTRRKIIELLATEAMSGQNPERLLNWFGKYMP